MQLPRRDHSDCTHRNPHYSPATTIWTRTPTRAVFPGEIVGRVSLVNANDFSRFLSSAEYAYRPCRALFSIEERTKKSSQRNTKLSCCENGVVRLPLLWPYPEELGNQLVETKGENQQAIRTSTDKGIRDIIVRAYEHIIPSSLYSPMQIKIGFPLV